MKKIVVIGAGIGGLASAALLAKEGYQVTLLEKNAALGGRARVWKKDGFIFDMGPSWYQIPEAFEHYFAQFGKKPSDFYTLKKLSPQYRVFTEGTHIDISSSLENTLDTFEKLESGAKQKVKKYIAFGKVQYDVLFKNIIYGDSSLLSFLKPKVFFEMSTLRTWQTLESFVSGFTKNSILKKILTYTSLFIGSFPKRMPALFSMLAYADLQVGTFYPMGGMGKVIEALEHLCKQNKVTIITNAEVEHINVTNEKVESVQTRFKSYKADTVIANADYPFVETTLLQAKYRSYSKKHWDNVTLSPSAFVIYLGISKKLKNVSHHNLYFADNWDEHFNDLFKDKKLPENPSYYVSCTSVTDSTVAPKGSDNLFFTVQIPSGVTLNNKMKEDYFNKIISHFENQIGEDIRNHIVVKRIFTESDFRKDYNAYQGAAIGLASTTMQSIFRPSPKSKKVQGLYYVGQYTVPGAGVPMCLISAEKIAKLIQLDTPNE